MPRVVHFEIHAADPERATRFYRAVFGWEIKKWESPEDYWLVTTGPEGQQGINGAIMRRTGPTPGEGVNGYVCSIDVSSVDESLAKISRHGGAVVMPKMAVPGVCWVAYCRDPEGNLFSLNQTDPSAR